MHLTLVLTHQCDLACTYCYAGPKSERRMPHSVGRRAVARALLGLEAGDVLDVGFFGGEPLLEWELAADLLRHARACAPPGVRVRAQVTTNGTHLTPALLDEALDLGVIFAVSMDGLPEVHDRFRPRRGGQPSSGDALRAIDLLAGRGVPFFVNAVVRPETVDRLAAGARFLAGRGVTAFLPSLDYGAAWRPDDAPALRAAIADLRRLYVERFPDLHIGWLETKALLLASPTRARPQCGAQREVAVAPSGRLYPCERLVGDDARDLGYGHVQGSGPLRCTGVPARAPRAGTPCGDCSTAPLCTNDCACANSARTGRADVPDGLICALEQACVEEADVALRQIAEGQRRLPLAGTRAGVNPAPTKTVPSRTNDGSARLPLVGAGFTPARLPLVGAGFTPARRTQP